MVTPRTSDPAAAAGPPYPAACAREVVAFLSRLVGGGPDTTGRVTISPAAGNAHALHAARHRLPQATLYHGAHAHPTIPALAARLGMPAVRVPCRTDGSMDPAALARSCMRGHGRAAVVVATAGTTMTGAVDDVPALRDAATLAGAVHLHVDGTSGGIVAAAAPGQPAFGFGAGADSVSLSGRRILGMPAPWGVALLRGGEPAVPGGGPPSAAAPGAGDTAVLLWNALRRLGVDGLVQRVGRCLETASYVHLRLAAAHHRPRRHPASLAVSFTRPPGWVCRKWDLALDGDRARIVATPRLTATAVDELAADLARGAAGPPEEGTVA
ncbi:MAG TPA: pyridoxal-dependent decarboxylase [Streptomyces sp.]|nr:pyridoxal-dependent decarboxylase [Streptomyces sp.]